MEQQKTTLSNSPLGPILIAVVIAATVLISFLASAGDRNLIQITAVPPTGTPLANAVPSVDITPPPTAEESVGGVVVVSSPTPPSQVVDNERCDQNPSSWGSYDVREGDTLLNLAVQLGVSVKELEQANCLEMGQLMKGMVIYLPLQKPTSVPCGAPANWVDYWVQPGDTMFGLALRYGITVYAIKQANCFTTTELIAGRTIKLPRAAAVIPTAVQPTAIPTIAPTLVATQTPTETAVPATLTLTPALQPSVTMTVTLTATPVLTATAAPSTTFTPEPTPTDTTATPTPSSTSAPTQEPTPTVTENAATTAAPSPEATAEATAPVADTPQPTADVDPTPTP